MRERIWRAKRERPARVDEVARREHRVLEPRDLRRQPLVRRCVLANALDRFLLRVDREDAPAAAQQLERVAPGSAAEVDGDTGLVEQGERFEQRLARLAAGRGVVPGPSAHEAFRRNSTCGSQSSITSPWPCARARGSTARNSARCASAPPSSAPATSASSSSVSHARRGYVSSSQRRYLLNGRTRRSNAKIAVSSAEIASAASSRAARSSPSS